MVYLGHQEVDLFSQLLVNSCVKTKTLALLVTQLKTNVETELGLQAYVCSVFVPHCAQHWDF